MREGNRRQVSLVARYGNRMNSVPAMIVFGPPTRVLHNGRRSEKKRICVLLCLWCYYGTNFPNRLWKHQRRGEGVILAAKHKGEDMQHRTKAENEYIVGG